VWPLLLIAVRKHLIPAIVSAAIVSLVAALWISRSDPSAAFFLMPFRVFEFAIGALVWFSPRLPRHASEAACTLGLALIAAAVTLLSSHASPAWMLIPTIGAALCILGGRDSLAGTVLRKPVAAWLGRASYSIYLVHWPLIVFTEYFNFSPLNRGQAFILFFASIGLGALLYHLIEAPIHLRKALKFSPGYGGPLLTAAAAALVALPAMLAIPDGLVWRIDKDAQKFDNSNSRVPQEIYGRRGCADRACTFGNPDGPNVLVFGDSHSDHLTRQLETMGGGKYHFHYAGAASCYNGLALNSRGPHPAMNDACTHQRSWLFEWLGKKKFTAVIVAQRWAAYYDGLLYRGDQQVKFANASDGIAAMLSDIEHMLAGAKARVLITGWAPMTNADCYLRPTFLPMKCPAIYDNYPVFRTAAAKFLQSTSLDARLVDVAALICPDGKCQFVDRDGRILYTDSEHLSVYGAALVVPKILSLIASP
jgi:hypothetical protein